MFDFEKPNIEIAEISEDKRYGKFVVEPLERGYGTTLGNSLRRIMLSSLPGAAVSQVKIDGVLHEFSSIAGVKEDVTEIIMNIKSLAIKNNSDTDEPKVAIFVLIVFSFNASKSRSVWSGFTLDWYKELFQNSMILDANKIMRNF